MVNERNLAIKFHGQSTGKMRSDIHVVTTNKEEFELATDEGPMLGGEGTAPPPLALFVASVAGCLMTQIRLFAKRLNVDLTSVEVDGVAKWVAITEGRSPYTSSSRGIELRITLGGDHTFEQARNLVQAGKKGCFVEQSVEPATEISHLLADGDEWIEL